MAINKDGKLKNLVIGLDILGFSLILGGAVGNLIDRIYFGYVIDFIDFRIWPVFNIADISVVIGVAIMIKKVIAHDFLRKNS